RASRCTRGGFASSARHTDPAAGRATAPAAGRRAGRVRRRPARCPSRSGGGGGHEDPLALPRLARKLFFCLAAACAATSSFAIARTALEKSAFESESTAGLPRLTASGTERSLGISYAISRSSAASTSFGFMPTLELARLSTSLIRSGGKE